MPRKSEPRLAFRDGVAADRPAIAALTREIWGGEDYLPHRWLEWVAAPRSRLRVALRDDRIVAVGRVRELRPALWWIEGIRVDPAEQGHGYASALYSHLFELAHAQPGAREIALATESGNAKIRHLATRSGMALVAEYRYLRAPGRTQPVPDVIERAPRAEESWAGAWLAASGGYVMDGWVARPVEWPWLREQRVIELGVARALFGRPDGQSWLLLVDAAPDAAAALVRHARHLAGADGVLRCFVPEGVPHPGDALADPGGHHFRIAHYAMGV